MKKGYVELLVVIGAQCGQTVNGRPESYLSIYADTFLLCSYRIRCPFSVKNILLCK